MDEPNATPDQDTIENMSDAELLTSTRVSIDSARGYWLSTGTDNHSIATGDIIDALDNLLVVVARLSERIAQ